MLRTLLPRLAALVLLHAVPVRAQVSTDDHALDQLKATPAAPASAAPAKPRPHARRTTRTEVHKPAAPAASIKKPLPPLPAAPPLHPVIAPPPIVMPAHPAPPPPPVPVKPDAAGVATSLPGDLERITFGPGSSDLNPATADAIRHVAASAVANPALTVTITAWAAGNNDDPSTPRRISLDRALAARAVLINAGVISERIHAIAKGFAEPGTGPIDRVDIAMTTPGGSLAPVKPAGSPPPALARQ
jgi:outer membrane protein OmpA-like peptidoglycan-associated protein